jgi:uncharacterized membrane protein YcaP (DUF421 family)
LLEVLHKRKRRTLFATELSALLRKTNIANDSDIEQALPELEADGAVVVRDHYCDNLL